MGASVLIHEVLWEFQVAINWTMKDCVNGSELLIKLRLGSDVIINVLVKFKPTYQPSMKRCTHETKYQLVWPNLPVHIPVAFSSSPLIHVLPEPG